MRYGKQIPALTFLKAYMYLLLGNSHWKSGDYEGAIQSFQCAVARVQHYRGEPLFIISLVSFLTGILLEIAHCS